MVSALVRRHPFASYYCLAFFIVSIVVVQQYIYGLDWAAAHGGQHFEYNSVLLKGIGDYYRGPIYANLISIIWVAFNRNPVYFGVLIFGAAPTISAIIVTALGWGWPGVKRLMSRFRPWPSRAFRRDALFTYGFITLFFFVWSLVNLAIIGRYHGMHEVLNHTGYWGLPLYLFPLTFLIGGLIDEGGTSEELGWRGFALPTLLDEMANPLVVAVFLGVLWWFWHFPREVPNLIAGKAAFGGQQLQWGTFLYYQALFLVLVVAMSIVSTFFFFKTGGSVIPGILLHGWANFISKGVGIYDITTFDVRTCLEIAAAILIIVLYGSQLGRVRYLKLQELSPQHSA